MGSENNISGRRLFKGGGLVGPGLGRDVALGSDSRILKGMKKCLLIVDMQIDFLPGGLLAVQGGDDLVPVINELAAKFPLVVATQDWHPAGHCSFASSHAGRKPFEEIDWAGGRQRLWPEHCVQGTSGADFAPGLDLGPMAAVFRKGMDPQVDSYSGFFDNNQAHRTGLAGYLRDLEVSELYVVGLAAEICVAFTAVDGVSEGFKTVVIEDAARAIDLRDFERSKAELKGAGVEFRLAKEVLAAL